MASFMKVSGGDGHAGYAGGWLGDGTAVGSEAFDVEVYCFANELFGCFVGWTSYSETRKVWDVGAPVGGGFLEDDGIIHVFCKFTGFELMDKQAMAKQQPQVFRLPTDDTTIRASLRVTFFIVLCRFEENGQRQRRDCGLETVWVEKQISPLRYASVEMTMQWFCEKRTGNGGTWQGRSVRPTHRGETAMDGAPDLRSGFC
jgi:hypothetical protein